MKKSALVLGLTSVALFNSPAFAMLEEGELTGHTLRQAVQAPDMVFEQGGRMFQVSHKDPSVPADLTYLAENLQRKFAAFWDATAKVWKLFKGEREGLGYRTFFDVRIQQVTPSVAEAPSENKSEHKESQ